ncbi:hypothetical protein CYMTET_43700 [Cymbomonas tetramitiformis]|uniref:Uncharacterized protein n=1 Tax=Cymbomonas tetramitiformis TaxID=36881 RepID=A0AAE0F1E2_9CHLO|nr:hypothetical protein CYMTET_43700 [Cymbomonas tetramitiformis]
MAALKAATSLAAGGHDGYRTGSERGADKPVAFDLQEKRAYSHESTVILKTLFQNNNEPLYSGYLTSSGKKSWRETPLRGSLGHSHRLAQRLSREKQDKEEPAGTSAAAGFDKLASTPSPRRHREPGEGDIEKSSGIVTGEEAGRGDDKYGEISEESNSGSDSDSQGREGEKKKLGRKPQKFQPLVEDHFWEMESDMRLEDATSEDSPTQQRPHYTGSKTDDSDEFFLALSRRFTGKQRSHLSMVRRTLNGPIMSKATPEDTKAFEKNSRPDWQGMYEELPSFLQSVGSESGTPSEAYAWLMESVEENGKMASRFVWFLKSTEEHEAADCAVNCADQPFHPLDRDAVWVVARKDTAEDAEGEVSDEYLHNGNSLVGLTGSDGLESTMFYWVLRKFVYELNKRFLMRGTKEKNDMLNQSSAPDDVRRRAIEECVSLLKITLFRNRVTENLRAQFPADKGDVEWKDLEDIVRVRDKIKDEVEECSLSIVQDPLRRQSCPYSV